MSRPERATRRKPADERRAEIIETASAIALGEGLDRVTARRVADALGVFPGLVNHYFRTADELVAAAFDHAATREHHAVFGYAEEAATPLDQIQRVLDSWLTIERSDPMDVVWFDAWQASRRRPALAAIVLERMTADLARLEALIRAGNQAAVLRAADPAAAAVCVMALVDATSVNTAIRDAIDYTPVIEMAYSATEATLGLPAGTLQRRPAATDPP
ncbi:MAG TPA: TetR family transcriptional regulator C-terminal domain-containing protein [Solirubrobacteraceae bacterium]|nr:TetR family transcriptional regulator C-terminal domain-containing protein [Solirubrobacteraceae bacterium]